jgi:hypothetical protein
MSKGWSNFWIGVRAFIIIGIFVAFIAANPWILNIFTSCVSCSYSSPSSSTYIHDESDTAYWNSVRKEKNLRNAGYDGAANMEENARHEYNHGGGYHDQSGNRQVDFQGSREQQQQLDEMKRRGW